MERVLKLMKKAAAVELMLVLLLTAGITSCNFWSTITGDIDDETEFAESAVEISSLSLGKTALAMKVGAMDYIAISVKPQTEQKNIALNWTYDDTVISCDTSSNWGITITALQEGQTSLKCSYGGYDATCIITVSGYEIGYETTTEPYIYSNSTVLQTSPGITEKVYVSLYGGDASDIDGFSWSIDNNSVATIQPTGQYCLITAKESGYTRIKVTHVKASYPYYIGIYVFADATKVTYITTQNNIITMNQEDAAQTIDVSLINGLETSLDSGFRWEILSTDSEKTPVGIDWSGNKAVVTPVAGGSCTLRVTHPDAAYPLDILCRVITVIKNVYIAPDSTAVTLYGDEIRTVTSTLENLKDGEYSVDEYAYQLDDYDVAEIASSIGNQVSVKGKANGSCKLLISHPKAAYAREVLLIVQGQLTDAVDASCYITTSQNYIRTKVGADATAVKISLKGGETGDESGFTWSVKSTAADGSSDVVRLETANGTALHGQARAALSTFAYGTAVITPNAEGTAVISISHPKILYPTEILVKVLSEAAVLTDPLYFSGNGLVRVLNGEETEYTVELKGKNKANSDDEYISFALDDTRLSVASSGNTARITAPAHGTGETISNMVVSHAKADTDKKVLIMTADDEETLMSMKALYSDKMYYNITVGESVTCIVNTAGFTGVTDDDGNYTPYDFSPAVWTVKDASLLEVEKNPYNPLACEITALKAGSTVLTAGIDGYSCDFTVTVYPEGTVQTDPEVYFTTTQNVVSIAYPGNEAQISVSAVNLPSSEYTNISWEAEDSTVVSVIGNGTRATVTALQEGETVIKVTHADSQNTLKIYIRIGSEYVIADKPNAIVYISSSDVLTMLRDANSETLQAVLVNYSETDTTGFSFSIDNESVAKITAQSSNGIAYVKPVGSGQAEITISHPKSSATKKVLVMVGNSAEELAGLVYMTTSNNVVAVGEGATKQVTVSIKNSEEIILDGYTWSSSNPAVVDVTGNGTTAMLTGNSVGTAMITISNKACRYPLTVIAQCVDPIAAAANPYIQLTSSVLTLPVSSGFTNVTADLVGGTESDYSDFIWTTADSGTCVVYGQNEVGKLRALKEGTTYITVSHPKASYTAQILVVCDKIVETECYISVPSSIITMKPTDASQTIIANLINGGQTDKYNFGWSLDVYDIIDFQYSANVCTISPKQSGTCTITLSHPKAAYDQQIIVNVQEYANFAFPYMSMTVTQGNTEFLNMQIPATNVATHVEYTYVKDATEQKVSVSGTKQVAQITGLLPGTCTVKAALVASSTGVVQATSEMLVSVKEKATDSVYITSGTTIYTVQKDKSQTLSATLSGAGVTTNDVYSLKWTCTDSDVIQITGISTDGTVTGNQIYITALKPGEALISCSHEKAASPLQFYIVVPGVAEKSLSLNKTLVTLMKGSSGTTVKAIIDNSDSRNDYHLIEWSIADVSGNGKEIARVLGNNQEQVTILPLAPGEALVTAVLTDDSGNAVSKASCNVIVQDTKSFVFETTTRRVQPFHSVKVKYTVSPTDAILTWTTTQTDDFFTYRDLGYDETGVGYLEITGVKPGNGAVYCTTNGGAKGTCTVQVSWDYSFRIAGQTAVTIPPSQTQTVSYTVSPADADITLFSASAGIFDYEISGNGDGTGTVTIKPLTESKSVFDITIRATNPANGDDIGTQTVKSNFRYEKLTPKLTFVSSDGNFSRFENDVVFVGDGETVKIKAEIAEAKADASISKVSFSPVASADDPVNIGSGYDEVNRILILNDSANDFAPEGYLIHSAKMPVYYPEGKTGAGEPLADFKTDLRWAHNEDKDRGELSDHWGLISLKYSSYSSGPFSERIEHTGGSADDIWCQPLFNGTYLYHKWLLGDSEDSASHLHILINGSPNWALVDNPAEKGKWYSTEEFESVALYYVTHEKFMWYGDFGHFGEHGGNGQQNRHNDLIKLITSDENGIVTQAVDAEKRPSPDTALVGGSRHIGNITVTFIHAGTTETSNITYPVYYEKRMCPKDQA